jgi:hypothetical protein
MAVRWRVKMRNPITCQPYVEDEYGEGTGCVHWKSFDTPPPSSVCKACPMVGMFCLDCPDEKICPKAGIPKIRTQTKQWLAMFYDQKNLGEPLSGLTNRDRQALRLISNQDSQIQAEVIKERYGRE